MVLGSEHVKSICLIAVGLHTATHVQTKLRAKVAVSTRHPFCCENGVDVVIRCCMQFEIGRSGGGAIRNSDQFGIGRSCGFPVRRKSVQCSAAPATPQQSSASLFVSGYAYVLCCGLRLLEACVRLHNCFVQDFGARYVVIFC